MCEYIYIHTIRLVTKTRPLVVSRYSHIKTINDLTYSETLSRNCCSVLMSVFTDSKRLTHECHLHTSVYFALSANHEWIKELILLFVLILKYISLFVCILFLSMWLWWYYCCMNQTNIIWISRYHRYLILSRINVVQRVIILIWFWFNSV